MAAELTVKSIKENARATAGTEEVVSDETETITPQKSSVFV